MATYKERVAALKKAGEETKRKYKEAKAKKKAAKAAKKAAKKPVSVVKTKGGDYPVYKKESKKAESFKSKFAKASKAGKKTFKWKGRSYTTEKAAPKKAAPKKAAPKKASKLDVRQIVKNIAKSKAKASPKKAAPSPTWGVEESKPSPLAPASKVEPKKEKPTYEELVEPYIKKSKETKKMEGGGKVEGGVSFNWPSRDARSGFGRKK